MHWLHDGRTKACRHAANAQRALASESGRTYHHWTMAWIAWKSAEDDGTENLTLWLHLDAQKVRVRHAMHTDHHRLLRSIPINREIENIEYSDC